MATADEDEDANVVVTLRMGANVSWGPYSGGWKLDDEGKPVLDENGERISEPSVFDGVRVTETEFNQLESETNELEDNDPNMFKVEKD